MKPFHKVKPNAYRHLIWTRLDLGKPKDYVGWPRDPKTGRHGAGKTTNAERAALNRAELNGKADERQNGNDDSRTAGSSKI